MRFKPITFSAVLVIALCGATLPADQPSGAAPASAFDAAFKPAPSAPPESPKAAADDTPLAEPAADSAAVPAPEPSAVPPAPDTAPASADAAVTPGKPAIPAKGKPPTREYFVGVWAEAGKSCDTALDFKADGTLIGPFPRWELSDTGELTMVGNRQKIFLTVVDANTLQSRRAPTDPPRTLKRCDGG